MITLITHDELVNEYNEQAGNWVQAGFVTEVTIDPRCPQHKEQFMRNYFEDLGIRVVESNCFGHAAGHFIVTPRRSLLERKA